MGNAVLRAHLFHYPEDIAELEIEAGNVYRDGHNGLSRVGKVSVIFAHRPYDISVNEVDKMELFERFDKVAGVQQTEGRVAPAHERLVSAYLPRLHPYDGLIVDADILLLYRLVNVVNNVLLSAQTLAEHFVINAVNHVVAVLYAVAGKSRVVAGKTHLCAAVVEEVDTRLDAHLLVDILVEKHFLVNSLDAGDNELSLAGGADEEMVVGEACAGTLAEGLADKPCEIAEHLVAQLVAVALVIELEIGYIEMDK